MKYYLIEVEGDSNLYLVKANNKTEAKYIIWSRWIADKNKEDIANGYTPIYKNEINVIALSEYDKELETDGFVIL